MVEEGEDAREVDGGHESETAGGVLAGPNGSIAVSQLVPPLRG